MKKKILILCNKDSGIYDFRKELLIRLLKENYEVIVSVPTGNCIDKIRELGCLVEETNFARRGMNPLQDLKLLRTYLKLIKKYDPSMVLTYTIKPNVYGSLASRMKKIPSIANVTGLGTTIFGGGLLGKLTLFLYRLGLKKVSCVFFQNQSDFKFMKEHGCIHSDYQILSGSGVNLEENAMEEYPPESDGFCFLSVMRIMKDKGIEELLEVADTNSFKIPVTFRLIGDYEAETREKYEPWIQRLQREGKLEYYGYREDSHDFMKNAHAIIHPSYHEGMSNVLLEAAATGRLVVATDIPGCRETFCENVSGIGMKPQSVDSLREAIQRVVDLSPKEREQMGKNGRKWVEERFDRQKVVDCYIKAIKHYEK